MSYFQNNNVVGFQVPASSTLVGQSFPDHFYYPFESQLLNHLPPVTTADHLHHFSSTLEKVPHSTKSVRGRSRSVSSKVQEKSSTADYIHVRARRGQATDSHSLAERVRREKISERMQTLQSLVPGCDKVTGKALKLDQIINYIQLLQTQVQYLSMKLASISPIYNDEMIQDQTNEPATTLAEHQLLQQVESLFAQDGCDEVLPWDLECHRFRHV